eukprot:COSAG04_NODE_1_length_58448_cov_23.476478_2_plen_68_part_00
MVTAEPRRWLTTSHAHTNPQLQGTRLAVVPRGLCLPCVQDSHFKVSQRRPVVDDLVKKRQFSVKNGL